MKLHDESGTYISFWPECGGKCAIKGVGSRMNSYEDDVQAEGEQPSNSYGITCSLDLEAIRDWFQTVCQTKNYTLFDNNCAKTIYLALQAGGLELFTQEPFATWGMFIRFPDDDDPTLEEYAMRNSVMERGGIEDFPVYPSTAFNWIVKHVESQKRRNASKCLLL